MPETAEIEISVPVGLNLDTFEEMKEQFAEKERDYLRKLTKYEKKAEHLIKQTDRVIEQLEIQNLVLKRVYEFIGQFEDYDENVNSFKKMIEGLEECDVLAYNTKQKWELYKSVQDLFNSIHQDVCVLQMSTQEPEI
jgi:hypothetical protein